MINAVWMNYFFPFHDRSIKHTFTLAPFLLFAKFRLKFYARQVGNSYIYGERYIFFFTAIRIRLSTVFVLKFYTKQVINSRIII